MSVAELVPQTGMVATVRNRRGVISCVRPFDGPEGVLNLVDVEYNDGDSPLEESLVWEREPFARLLPPAALPDIVGTPPMNRDDLTAMVRACRWTAKTPFIDPDGEGPLDRLPITSPFHGAVQVEDYQLLPLLKALRMPRVSLLIADDVGLGKTIEAGLVLSELLLRRRIRRVLIMTPASLRGQWRDEMWTKFSLPFEVVDRGSTQQLRKQLGLDANPWRSHSRIITSYHYLKQADVLQEFLSAARNERVEAHLPWDLLIVDEAHNLTPSPFGEESDLCKMLRQVSPMFEHKLFLTATPHNGHTWSFTGLLQLLDPVRFTQTDKMSDAEKARVSEVRVRRLKREINRVSDPPRFCERLAPKALVLEFSEGEKALYDAFSDFRCAIRELIKKEGRRRRTAGNFAVEILGKRLLSCPTAFAQSWLKCKAGMAEDADAEDTEVIAAERSVKQETTDDREADSRSQSAAVTVGAWLRPFAADLKDEIEAIDAAVGVLGFSEGAEAIEVDPNEDARFAALEELIDSRLRSDGKWLDDDRLVVFTEYKTTLDYLLRRLRKKFGDDNQRVLCLYGGMGSSRSHGHDRISGVDWNAGDRDDIKRAFNDPGHEVRILVATDAASEGLNLQETSRYLLHYDVPWNPARLEQRNGRLDRHGQARDVQTWHFVSEENHDLSFLGRFVEKVGSIREDLGPTGSVFDELTYRRLVAGEDVKTVSKDMDTHVDKAVETARENDDCGRDEGTGMPEDLQADLRTIADELDLDPSALRQTLDSAMAVREGRPRVSEPSEDGTCALVPPTPVSWEAVIDESLRVDSRTGVRGALQKLAFDPQVFVREIGGRPVYKPRVDTALMHLAHPMLQRALSGLTRLRFPGSGDTEVSRWSVRRDSVPNGCDAVIEMTVEELAVNELRETFHHWVRTFRIPVSKGKIEKHLPHTDPVELRTEKGLSTDDADDARDLWSEVEGDVKALIKRMSKALTKKLAAQMESDRKNALEAENKRYQSRQGEVSALIENTTMAKLERELEKLRLARSQGLLFDQERAFDNLDKNIEERQEELKRRKRHYEEVREQLSKERERIVNHLIPKRHTMRGDAQVMPVSLEIVLPEGRS